MLDDLDLLKQPSFDYKGVTHFLCQQFTGKSFYTEDGEEHDCTDPRIIKTTFSIRLTSKKRLREDGLSSIRISFVVDSMSNLRSYAAFAMYVEGESNTARTPWQLKATLDAKYGASHCLEGMRDEHAREMRAIFYDIGGVPECPVFSDLAIPASEWELASGPEIDCESGTMCIWGTGQIALLREAGTLSGFCVYYAETRLTNYVRNLHNEALRDCLARTKESGKAKKQKMMEDF